AATGVLRWMMLCFPCSALSATIVARHRRELSFKPLAIRSLIGRLSGALGGIVLVALGAGIGGLIAQQILILLTGALILWATSRSRPRLRFAWAEFRQLAGFGLYAVGALFLSFSIRRIFTIVSGIFLGFEAAGYLNLSLRVIDVFWSIAATAANQVALPFLSNLQSDADRLKAAFRTATSFVCLVLSFCFTLIAVCAPEVVEVVCGHKWLPSAPYISVLAMLVLVQAPRLLISPLLTAKGRPKDLVAARLAEFVFLGVTLAVLRTPTIAWAVGIWVAREVAMVPLTTWMTWKASGFGVTDQFHGALTSLLAALVMAVVTLGAKAYLLSSYGPVVRLVACAPVALLSFALAVGLLNRVLALRFSEFFRLALARGPHVGVS
ncbi:MAG TPA: oligosaccharide flippase family protein, partial [Polyangia bacterium]|nr:oligosaccharide flippase family protein [Polyangia bacterium]